MHGEDSLDKVMEIQKCLKTPKPYKYPFGKKRIIHSCRDCGLYGICNLTSDVYKVRRVTLDNLLK